MKKFTKRVEDFTCTKCGTEVKGSGYTNHCPQCLWSQHVDKNPGDRAEECRGMMEPIGILISGQDTRIGFRCEKCGTEKIFSAAEHDNADALVQLSKKPWTPRV
jgi:predicted RNA-binding Zn-ribbon protein involved in translation (DUF1610 family)